MELGENRSVKLEVIDNRTNLSPWNSFRERARQLREPIVAALSVSGVVFLTDGGIVSSVKELVIGGLLLSAATAPIVHEIRRGWNREFPTFHG